MSESRRDSDIPSIKPAQDEVASYRRSQERSSRPEGPQQSSFNGTLVFVIIVLAIVMGVGLFTLFEVQQQLDQTTRLLAKSKDQITELERRLAETDQDFAKSGKTVGKRLDTNESEIRKLWDVSNKRNRQWIRENQGGIKSLQDSLGKERLKVAELSTSVGDVTGRFEQLDTDVQATKTSLGVENEELATAVSMVRGQLQDQVTDLSKTNRSVSLIDARVASNEEAISAIDRHRLQLNKSIAELQDQLKQLQLQTADASGP